MVMGRNTYEVYAAVWPGRDGEYADAINAIPKYVASTTLTEPTWHNTTVLPGELVEAVRALRDRDDASILMHGYGPVAKTLLEGDLLNELHLWVHPHLAGVGEPADLLIQQGLNKKLHLAYEFVSWAAPKDEAASRRGVEDMLDRIEDGVRHGTI